MDLSVVHSLAEQKTDSIWQVLRDRVEELVSDGKLADRIVAIMQKCGTKQDLHTALMKDLWDIDSEKRGEIYRIIRPLFGKI